MAGQDTTLNTVLIDPESFRFVFLMGSEARREFTEQRMRNEDKPQKRNSDGLPLWSVQVSATDWRGRGCMFTATVPSQKDPAELLPPGTPVNFDRLVFGVSPKRDGSGYSTWAFADAIHASNGAPVKA